MNFEKQARVQLVSAILLIFVVVMQMVLATNSIGINMWYDNYSPSNSQFWLVFNNLVPWWHYGKILSTILDKTGVQGQDMSTASTLTGKYNKTAKESVCAIAYMASTCRFFNFYYLLPFLQTCFIVIVTYLILTKKHPNKFIFLTLYIYLDTFTTRY